MVVGYFVAYKMISDIILTLNTKHTWMWMLKSRHSFKFISICLYSIPNTTKHTGIRARINICVKSYVTESEKIWDITVGSTLQKLITKLLTEAAPVNPTVTCD